jgi:hypothetical protein
MAVITVTTEVYEYALAAILEACAQRHEAVGRAANAIGERGDYDMELTGG